MPVSSELLSCGRPALPRPRPGCRGGRPPAEGAPGLPGARAAGGEAAAECAQPPEHTGDQAAQKTSWLRPHLPTDGGRCPR